jgi:molybdopterin-synthase adenylyltransferase
MTLNDDQLVRYSRQILMPSIDLEGQERLLGSTALIVGAGGLGCPVAMYLAAAGVGTLILVDFDTVDLSNLQRQVGHTMADIGQLKTDSLKATIFAQNPDINVICINSKIEYADLSVYLDQIDVVVECSDNVSSRYFSNDFCVQYNLPLVNGAAIGLDAQVSVFNYGDHAPCYRCLFDNAQDEQLSCAQNGVLGPLVGMVGSMQAIETIKVLSGIGKVLSGRLLIFDALAAKWQSFNLKKSAQCQCCSDDADSRHNKIKKPS